MSLLVAQNNATKTSWGE